MTEQHQLILREALVFMPRYCDTDCARLVEDGTLDPIDLELRPSMEDAVYVQELAEQSGKRAFLDKDHDGKTEMLWVEKFVLLQEGIVVVGTWTPLGLAYRLANRIRGVSPAVRARVKKGKLAMKLRALRQDRLIESGARTPLHEFEIGCVGAICCDDHEAGFGPLRFVRIAETIDAEAQFFQIWQALKSEAMPPCRLLNQQDRKKKI